MGSDEEKTSSGRAGKPKVRTGCKTCKRRKVKCDEGRPSCSRCLKFGTECEGYRASRSEQSVKHNNTVPANRERFLLPNDPHLVLRRSSEPFPFRTQPQTGLEQLHTDLDDQQYLRLRQSSLNNSSVDLDQQDLKNTPLDYQTLNTNFIPEPEPLILQIKDSITALSKAKTSERSAGSFGLAAAHYSHAFRQYGRALEGIQEMASSTVGTQPSLTLLHAKVLIYIFESIQGDSPMAITHLKSAYDALIMRDPSMTNIELARILEDIDDNSSVDEFFLRLKNLQDHRTPTIRDTSGSVPSSFG